jgi:hypothetical protein
VVRGQKAQDRIDGRRFADWVFDAEHLGTRFATGFKLMYHHARRGSFATVWDYLESLEGLKVLHLSRSNLLEVLVSRRLAERRGVWHVEAPFDTFRMRKRNRGCSPPNQISCECCISF